jgi:hypothetical protein
VVEKMTVDENTGDTPACPICKAERYWDCGHLVANFDMTFGECQNGAIYDRMDEFTDALDRAFLIHLTKGADPYFSDMEIQCAWDSALENFEPEDETANIERGLVLQALASRLIDCGACELEGDFLDEGGPGMSSAVTLLFAENPSEVIEKALAAWLKIIAEAG